MSAKRDLGGEFARLRKLVPSVFYGLNSAQWRCIRSVYSSKDEWGGLPPTFSIVSMANGCGKTMLMVLDMIGWTMGSEFLRKTAWPREAIVFYDGLEEWRAAGTLNLRLTCASDDMKEGGSVLAAIKEAWPWAKLGQIDSGKCYRQIEVEHPRKAGVKNTIAVRTFDQDPIKHSGSNCRRVWINEPVPHELVGETIGRIRSKAGEPEGSIMMTGTLLEGSEWVDDLGTDKALRVVNCRGHLYENCVSEEVTEEMAVEVEQKLGVALDRVPGGGFRTNGVLSRSSIETQVRLWQRMCPHQLEARKAGAKLSAAGKVFTNFREEVHVVPSSMYEKIPKEWPVFQVVDPHSAKDDFSAWFVITPSNRLVAIAEWPNVEEYGPYENQDGRRLTIRETCETWRIIEADLGITSQIIRRIGDPNRFNEPNPRNMSLLKNEYSANGFDFETTVSDDIEMGERKISEFLWYDPVRYKQNPEAPENLPRLLILSRCYNIITHVGLYSRKRVKDPTKGLSERTEQKYACVVACVRYAVMSFEPFSDIRITGSNMTDYDKIRAGRMPRNPQRDVIVPKGHRLLPW
jgi:hypothetical protein